MNQDKSSKQVFRHPFRHHFRCRHGKFFNIRRKDGSGPQKSMTYKKEKVGSTPATSPNRPKQQYQRSLRHAKSHDCSVKKRAGFDSLTRKSPSENRNRGNKTPPRLETRGKTRTCSFTANKHNIHRQPSPQKTKIRAFSHKLLILCVQRLTKRLIKQQHLPSKQTNE